MLNKDPELKAKRGYSDPDSFVRNDGTEVLYGTDWKKRVQELLFRCKGRCEYTYIDERRCTAEARDPHHIKHRWPYRIDNLWNLIALCGKHHDLMDGRKIGGRKHEKSMA